MNILARIAFLAAMSSAISTFSAAEDPAPPAQQFREHLKAFNAAGQAFRAAQTDQQRKMAVEHLDELPTKFLELADRHPTDPIALRALRQAVQAVVSVDSLAHHCAEMNRRAFPVGSRRNAASRIVEILLRDHSKSDQLAPICDRMRFGAREEFERFLSVTLETSPHRDVQGMACLGLAQLLQSHLRMIDLMNDRPALAARYEHIFGKGFVEAISAAGRPALAKRVESLYEQATSFDDVINSPFRETVAAKAKQELYAIRHLSVGKLAPEIEGHDQDSQPLKLSDYRGKVVLLYFWQEY